jgi:hypothetical protein
VWCVPYPHPTGQHPGAQRPHCEVRPSSQWGVALKEELLDPGCQRREMGQLTGPLGTWVPEQAWFPRSSLPHWPLETWSILGYLGSPTSSGRTQLLGGLVRSRGWQGPKPTP